MFDMIINAFENIVGIVMSIWEYVKKIFVSVLNFFSNIRSFFKDPQRLNKLRNNKDLCAVVVKKFENGEYNVVNCLFDKEKHEIIDYEEDALGVSANSLDAETKKHFGDKDMIILK